ncbi:MAG: recombination regulator RecX [Treponema sp.]|jgi:regulatory protein|nr:recombination regulator RecX [Treponema sp.]
MTLVSLKSGTENGAGFLKITLSDDSSFSVKTCYLSQAASDLSLWEEGREISPAEEEDLRFAAACYRAEQDGLRLIARAEQTEAGLSRKLGHRGHDSAGVSAVVSRFVSLGLINDERYAELWIRSRLARRSGKIPTPRTLLASLRNRGIDSSSAGKALKSILDEETELALLKRYMGQTSSRASLPVSSGFSLRGVLKFEGFSQDVLSVYFED